MTSRLDMTNRHPGEVWIPDPLPGGWVCAMPDPAGPDGICGMPTESEPCSEHHNAMVAALQHEVGHAMAFVDELAAAAERDDPVSPATLAWNLRELWKQLNNALDGRTCPESESDDCQLYRAMYSRTTVQQAIDELAPRMLAWMRSNRDGQADYEPIRRAIEEAGVDRMDVVNRASELGDCQHFTAALRAMSRIGPRPIAPATLNQWGRETDPCVLAELVIREYDYRRPHWDLDETQDPARALATIRQQAAWRLGKSVPPRPGAGEAAPVP